MNKKIKTLIFTFLLASLGTKCAAFTLPESELTVGMPVLIENVDELMHYAIFLPPEEPTNMEVCASISGEELMEENNLRKYGTCFINDAGTFTIVEIEDPFSSSYQDLVENELIIQEEKVALSLPNPEILKLLMETKQETTSTTESIYDDIEGYILGAKTSKLARGGYIAILIVLLVTSLVFIFIIATDLAISKKYLNKRLKKKVTKVLRKKKSSNGK